MTNIPHAPKPARQRTNFVTLHASPRLADKEQISTVSHLLLYRGYGFVFLEHSIVSFFSLFLTLANAVKNYKPSEFH